LHELVCTNLIIGRQKDHVALFQTQLFGPRSKSSICYFRANDKRSREVIADVSEWCIRL